MTQSFDPFEGFAADLYLATLSAIGHADGLQPVEAGLLQERASALGVDLKSLPEVPKDLSDLPWATRVLVLRDAIALAVADSDTLSDAEDLYLHDLCRRMAVPEAIRQELESWVADQSELLERFARIAAAAP